ncbi:hypothetical protein D9M71_608180 [compost metagenome]
MGVVQRAGGQFGLGLGAVVGFQPQQAAMQAIVATQAQHGSAVESVAGGQVVGATAVQGAIGDAIAQVRAVVVDQKTTAQANGLAARGSVHAIFAQHREQLA